MFLPSSPSSLSLLPFPTGVEYWLTIYQLALVASCALLSVCVSLGYGKHNWDIPPENFEDILLYSYAAGFASILAALWSKLSFAITLLRITKGRPRRLLWFIIGSVSFVLGANATVHWVQCWPLERLWQAEKEGSCIRRKIIIDYNIFAAGKWSNYKERGLSPGRAY